MISSCVINQFLIDLLNRICRINWTGAQSNGSNDSNNVNRWIFVLDSRRLWCRLTGTGLRSAVRSKSSEIGAGNRKRCVHPLRFRSLGLLRRIAVQAALARHLRSTAPDAATKHHRWASSSFESQRVPERPSLTQRTSGNPWGILEASALNIYCFQDAEEIITSGWAIKQWWRVLGTPKDTKRICSASGRWWRMNTTGSHWRWTLWTSKQDLADTTKSWSMTDVRTSDPLDDDL